MVVYLILHRRWFQCYVVQEMRAKVTFNRICDHCYAEEEMGASGTLNRKCGHCCVLRETGRFHFAGAHSGDEM